ncbi:hypothetical protein ABE272_15105 [Priestia aryabhattai]
MIRPFTKTGPLHLTSNGIIRMDIKGRNKKRIFMDWEEIYLPYLLT